MSTVRLNLSLTVLMFQTEASEQDFSPNGTEPAAKSEKKL